tara:strand:- start:1852 stop:2487 length:636 start_codon:yes stop_codon:yes gene_type:complete
MQVNNVYHYIFPYFRNSVETGFKRYGQGLTRNIILSQDVEAVFALQDYLAHMLTSSVIPREISPKKRTRIRGEYVFELVQLAQATDFPPTRISIYDYTGKLALFTATVIPESLKKTLLRPKDYIKFANGAYTNVVTAQQRYTGNASPVHVVLAEKTGEIAKVLTDIAEQDIQMHGRLMLGRPLLTLEQIAQNEEPCDAIAEAERILDDLSG